MKCPYTVIIQWSVEDQIYVVTLPEFPGCHTHGKTYEEAAKNGREVLEMLLEMYHEENRSFPKPCQFGDPLMIPGDETTTKEKVRKNSAKRRILQKSRAT